LARTGTPTFIAADGDADRIHTTVVGIKKKLLNSKYSKLSKTAVNRHNRQPASASDAEHNNRAQSPMPYEVCAHPRCERLFQRDGTTNRFCIEHRERRKPMSAVTVESKDCAFPGCGKPFKPRSNVQKYCEEHVNFKKKKKQNGFERRKITSPEQRTGHRTITEQARSALDILGVNELTVRGNGTEVKITRQG
jgi:hypothetical protein